MPMKDTKDQQTQVTDLSALQVKYVPATEMTKLKEKTGNPINPLALRIAAELFENPEIGGRVELNTPALQQARKQIRTVLSNGLSRAAKREKKNVRVRCVSNPTELVFYYVPAKPKENKAAAEK